MEKINQHDYDKAVGQFRLALNDVFSPFNELGHQILIPGAIAEVVELAEKFGMRVRKKDIAISLEKRRNSRYDRRET